MKTLFLFLILSFGFSATIKAQKVDVCTPEIPKGVNWIMVYNSPLEGDISKFKLTPLKEGTNLNDTFRKEADASAGACYLDSFLKNTKVIPEDWKKITVIFTGTVFKEYNKYIVYRTLYFNKDKNEWTEGKNYGDYILENTYQLVLTN